MTKLVSQNVRGCSTGRNILHGMIILASVYFEIFWNAFVCANDMFSLTDALKTKQHDYVRTK